MNVNAPPRAGRREWLGLALLALPTIVLGLDLTVLHLAVPQLSADLRPSSSQLLWITDIYGFLIAGFLITMGTLGDRIGRRRLLIIGAAAFGLASVLAAFATSAEMLIASRALLGVTGATLMPSTLSLISNMFKDPAQRGFAIAIWMINFMVGGAIGPLLGGILLERFWWGSVFLLAVPIMAVLILLARPLLPEYRNPSTARLDASSVVLSLTAILAVIFGVKELARDGIAAMPLVILVAGLVVGIEFVRRQRRLPDPLMDMSLFRSRTFSTALGAQLTGLFAIAGIQFLVLQHLQLVEGLTPLRAGALVVPAMVASVISSLIAPILVRRLRHSTVIAATMLIGVLGLVMIAQAGPGSGAAPVVVGFTIVTLALNPAVALTYDLVIGSAPPERAGSAAGIAETASELGLALGVAASGSLATAIYRRELTGDALPREVPAEAADRVRDTLGGAVDVAGGLDGQLAIDLIHTVGDAFTRGLQVVAMANAVVIVVAAVLAAVLLRGPGQPRDAAGTGDAGIPARDDETDVGPSAGGGDEHQSSLNL